MSIQVGEMDTEWPDALEADESETPGQLRAVAAALRKRSAYLRENAQRADDPQRRRKEIAAAQSLDASATDLELRAQRMEAAGT